MTCPSLLRRGHLAGEAGGTAEIAGTGLHRAGDTVTQAVTHARNHLRGDDTFGQFARFVVVGGLSTLLYGLVFITANGFGDQLANLIGAVLSTLLANELHRRLTFHAGGRVSWFTAQWEGGGLAAVGLIATSLSLAGFHALFGDVHALAQISLVTAVTGAIGAMRFVALRAWVFSTGTAQHD
ncbi:GtrA family protein [Modestobacter lapidis]|nr:GtrA family protein [Modestobacter lapidis]